MKIRDDQRALSRPPKRPLRQRRHQFTTQVKMGFSNLFLGDRAHPITLTRTALWVNSALQVSVWSSQNSCGG